MKPFTLFLLGGSAVVGYINRVQLKAWWKKKFGPGPGPSPAPAPSAPQVGTTVGTSLGASTATGQTYNYSGTVQSDVQSAATALAAVSDGGDPANVMLVRAFQSAAGLTVDGQTDGRYGSNTAEMLSHYADPVPPPVTAEAWWGPPGTYTNPDNPADTGP